MNENIVANTEDDLYHDENYNEEDLTCKACHGTSGNSWYDGSLLCPECDCEGYMYWL